MRGTMIWFNKEKGYGFIRTDDDERLYVARSGFEPQDVPESRCGGREVTFERLAVEGDSRAVNVSFVPDEGPGRRARLRSPRTGSRL